LLWQEARRRLQEEMAEAITLDGLTGPYGALEDELCTDDAGCEASWLIAQRKKGHRHSIDDVLTAWFALRNAPPVSEHLDLGTGIGTVGFLTLWGMGRQAELTCVEAQDISFRLLQANIDTNGLRERVHAHHGDLRSFSAGRTFPLVTGSPPYFPTTAGIVPQDSQKAHARFELRGDVADYAIAAAAHLDADGFFVLCFPSPQRDRALAGIRAAGLEVVRLKPVVPRDSLAPLFDLIACRHASATDGKTEIEAPLIVRERCGKLSEAMSEVRHGFGFAPI
jgi:tRNA1Val (adenine37-N6)-methyltransferase